MSNSLFKYPIGKTTVATLLSLCIASNATFAQGKAENAQAEMRDSASGLISVFNTLQSYFSSSTRKLRDLVEKGELDRAYELYFSKWAELEASPDAQPIVANMAESWNRRAAPQLSALTVQLRAINPATGPSQWADWSRSMSQAKEVLEKNKANLLLMKFPSAEASVLQSALNEAEQRLADAMPSQFIAYDLAAQPDFFAAYPLSIAEADKGRLVTERAPAVAQVLSSYKIADATQALKNYLPFAGTPTARQQWMQGWVNAYGRERQWGIGMGLAQKMEAGRSLKDVIPEADVKVTIALLPVFAPDIAADRRDHMKRRAERLAQRLEADLQPEAEYSQAMAQVAALRSSYNLVVLADVGRLQGVERTLGPSVQQGRFLARHDVHPNPEQQRLTQELIQAQNTLARAQMEQKRAEEQARNIARQSQGMAMLGVLTATASIFDTNAAKNEVMRLRRELNQTPATISTPVYDNYERKTVMRRLTAIAPVSLYVVDSARNMVRSITLPSIHEAEYIAYENPHPADPDVKQQVAPEQEKRIRRDELVQRALTTLPDGVPSVDKLIELTEAGTVPSERLSQLMVEEQVRFQQEVARRRVEVN